MNTILPLCGILMTASLLMTTDARAEPVPIKNPGFESVSRPLEGGEQTNGIGGEGVLVGTRSPYPFGVGLVSWAAPVTVPGWRTFLVPFGDPGEVFAGVLHPTEIDGTPFVTDIEGDNVLSVQAALVGQETTTILEPNTTYTLSFLGGISQFDSEYFLSVTLTAIDDTAPLPTEGQPGVTRLALGAFFPPTNEPDGIMRRYQFSYTSPKALPAPLVGTRVGITVFGSDGLPRVIYDDFALTARCAVDFTCDGELDIFDILGFLDAFNAGDSSADFTGDGSFDIFDVLSFLDAFNAGCP